MSLKATWFQDKLRRMSKQGFQGFPVATVAYYGPSAACASKVAVSVILSEGAEPESLERWYSEVADVRKDPQINEAVTHFIQKYGVKSVVMPDRIMAVHMKKESTTPKVRTVLNARTGRVGIASPASSSGEGGL
jgi:hypothetical protein